MAKAKTPRTPKPKAEKVSKKVLQMPELPTSGNGNYSPADLEAEIRIRAYLLYEQRGYTNGRADQDWVEAEREVLGRQEHSA
jgi:hypothetical protein